MSNPLKRSNAEALLEEAVGWGCGAGEAGVAPPNREAALKEGGAAAPEGPLIPPPPMRSNDGFDGGRAAGWKAGAALLLEAAGREAKRSSDRLFEAAGPAEDEEEVKADVKSAKPSFPEAAVATPAAAAGSGFPNAAVKFPKSPLALPLGATAAEATPPRGSKSSSAPLLVLNRSSINCLFCGTAAGAGAATVAAGFD